MIYYFYSISFFLEFAKDILALIDSKAEFASVSLSNNSFFLTSASCCNSATNLFASSNFSSPFSNRPVPPFLYSSFSLNYF